MQGKKLNIEKGYLEAQRLCSSSLNYHKRQLIIWKTQVKLWLELTPLALEKACHNLEQLAKFENNR